MVGWVVEDKIGLLAVFETQGDVFKESGLIVFDREVVMGFTVSDQILGDLALGQEGIGGDFFALDIDGIKQRDGGFDFVGAFELFTALYGQGAYFFWA